MQPQWRGCPNAFDPDDLKHLLAVAQRATAAAEVAGIVRTRCPEPIVARFTDSTLLQRLQARHPGLQLHFVMSDRYVDLGRGEADVALQRRAWPRACGQGRHGCGRAAEPDLIQGWRR